MPSRVPLTNLRDKTKGGAPEFVGTNIFTTESSPTPPLFTDDNDPLLLDTKRRGLINIAHIPPAGASTVDFVTLFLRNTSLTEKAFVNVLLASDIAVQLRIRQQIASPLYADVLIVEDDIVQNGAPLSTTIDSATNEISIDTSSLGTTMKFDTVTPPRVVFEPPAAAGNLAASVTLNASGSISNITVFNPSSHTYTTPPTARLVGGVFRPIGFFESFDEETIIRGSATSGSLTAIGTLLRTEFANNISVADVVLLNNELRVVRSVSTETKEIIVDAPLTGSTSEFDTWSFIPFLSATKRSQYRLGNGLISNKSSLGDIGVVCSERHQLSIGDYIIYRYGNARTLKSNRVTDIINDFEFTVEKSSNLSSSENTEWHFVYLLSETTPGSTTSFDEIKICTYIRMKYDDAAVVETLGLGARQLFLQNKNFFNQPGSYFDESVNDTDRIVQFGELALSHNTRPEVANPITPETVLEIEIKASPNPETQVISGFPLNGGSAGETGRRPIVACYQRGSATSNVLFWGYSMRYTPESSTNYTQTINI